MGEGEGGIGMRGEKEGGQGRGKRSRVEGREGVE